MIVQLGAFDYLTAPPSRLVSTAGLWSALPRISRGLPVARLLIVADTLQRADITQGFQEVATPEQFLPPGVMAYRIAYEDFLHSTVQAVRYTRLYLTLDPNLEEDALIALLGAYGVQATPLDHELPRPFTRAAAAWDHLKTSDGRLVGMLRSRYDQYGGVLHPQVLHNLLAQEFPLWIAVQVYTFPQQEAMQLLRIKGAMARYGDHRSDESVQQAQTAAGGVQALRDVLTRGESLHAVRVQVVVDGEDEVTLNRRLEIVRGVAGLEMERVYGMGADLEAMFSADVRPRAARLTGASLGDDGMPLTTSGVAILAGSALSYRRRTEKRGVMLGIDRNQSPVVVNIFDDRAPSYNTVVLGQTGSGKTFAMLMMMMRHLLTGVRLVIIDPQGNIDLSFLGEDVYQRSVLGTSQSSVNVLDVVHEEIGSQVELALSMLRMLGVWSQDALDRALLDEALMALYQPIWNTPGAPAPTLVDLQRRLNQHPAQDPEIRAAVARLALALDIYVNGSQAALFGRQTTVDFRLDHAVNVFDVSKLPQQGMGGNLRSALLSILVANINQGIRRRRMQGDRAPIMFFVDEMGILMRDPVIAEYISSEYKTARARLVGMIVADQDLHSLLGPRDEKGLHHGIPMLANAANVLIFNQKDSERGRIREHFPGLPEALVDALPMLPRGTCLASFPDDLLVVNVLPSTLERIVFSSRLQDKLRAKQIVAQLQAELAAPNANLLENNRR